MKVARWTTEWTGGRPMRRFPRSAPLSVLVLSILFILFLLFLMKGTWLNQHIKGAFRYGISLKLPDEDLEGASQDLPDLITYIKQLHLKAPSEGLYKLHSPEKKDFSQNGQSKIIAQLYKNMTNGKFVEAGAYNGEDYSNTLYLEREFGWTGLLVEPDPWNFWALNNRARRAHSIQACLSPVQFPREVTFKQSDTMGHIAGSNEAGGQGIYTRVKCFPLYSLLLATNLTTVHLLSLDLEGLELQVLKTIPWNKVDIKVVLVEFLHIPEGVATLVDYMRGQGYLLHKSVGDDHIYVKKFKYKRKFKRKNDSNNL